MNLRTRHPAASRETKPEDNDDNDDLHLKNARGRCLSTLKSARFPNDDKLILVIGAILAVLFSLSYLMTGTFLWKMDDRVSGMLRKTTQPKLTFTDEELLKYDGSDESLPLYVAINGEVFDVSAGRTHYGPGGGYAFFAGKDAARAYVTGCFKDHLTHDLRGLSDEEIKGIDGWAQFYHDSNKYKFVGHVIHEPIDPASPIPADCKPKDQPKS